MPGQEDILEASPQNFPPQASARASLGRIAAERAKKNKRGYRVNTTPYYTKTRFCWQIVPEQLPAAPAAPTLYIAKLVPQTQRGFGFKIGETFGDGISGIQKKATRADTNLTEAFQTVADEDVAFEGISARACAAYIVWPEAAIPAQVTDAQVKDALLGKSVFYDVSGLMVAAQIRSPFNLQDNLDQMMRDKISCGLLWGGKTFVPLGTMDYLHDNTAKSYLGAAGIPCKNNIFRQSEGHQWEGEGTDSNLEIIAQVEEGLSFPFSATTFPGAADPAKPLFIICEYKWTVEGIAFREVGRNG